jgi:cobalt/nickel transport protein
MKLITKNGLLLILVVVLAFAPLYIARTAEFAGADAQASVAISTFNADYAPWFEPFWKPPSGEVESFLFALQAAIGSGFVFYYLGYAKGKHSASKKDQP